MIYSIKEVAEMMDINPHTLRYYDKEGMLINIKRNKTGNREFSESDIETLSLILCLKNTGMSLREIKQFLDWENSGYDSLHSRYEMLKKHELHVLEQIENLKNDLKLINHKLAYYKEACNAYDNNSPIPICCKHNIK